MFKDKAGEIAERTRSEAEKRSAWLAEQVKLHLAPLREVAAQISAARVAKFPIAVHSLRMIDNVIDGERLIADFRAEAEAGRDTTTVRVALIEDRGDGGKWLAITVHKMHDPEDKVEYRFCAQYAADAQEYLIETLAIYGTDPHQPLPKRQDEGEVRVEKKSGRPKKSPSYKRKRAKPPRNAEFLQKLGEIGDIQRQTGG